VVLRTVRPERDRVRPSSARRETPTGASGLGRIPHHRGSGEIGVVVFEVHPATPEHLKEIMPFVHEGPAETAEESGLTIVGGEQE